MEKNHPATCGVTLDPPSHGNSVEENLPAPPSLSAREVLEMGAPASMEHLEVREMGDLPWI